MDRQRLVDEVPRGSMEVLDHLGRCNPRGADLVQGEPMSVGTLLYAGRDDECDECGADFRIGDLIAGYNRGWVCEECADKLSEAEKVGQ